MLATVVWRRAPSSGKEGATALITADRTVHGWLGGACAEPTVIREALRALEEGDAEAVVPRHARGARGATRATASSRCRSRARARARWRCTWNPCCPQPQLIAIGRSPVAASLAALAAALGWRSVRIDEAPSAARTIAGVATADHDARPRCGRRRRPLVRRRRDAGPLRRGGARRARSRRRRLRRAGRVAQARRLGARLPAGSRGRRRGARARARAGRTRSRPRLHRGDRGRDPGRDRCSCAPPDGCAPPRRRARRARGDRSRVRHDGRRRGRSLLRDADALDFLG